MRRLILTLALVTLSAGGYAVRSRGEVRYLASFEPWSTFSDVWQQLSGEGLRLISIQTSGGRWSGAFVPGNDAYYLWVGQEWPSFEAKWRDLTKGNLRLVDLVVEESESGAPHFSGAWREGNDGHYLQVGLSWNDLVARWKELNGQDLRLIKCVTYREHGVRKFAGVWREGHDAYALYFSPITDFESKWRELAAQSERLVDMQIINDGGQPMV